jgi:hypothetical protein
MDQMQELSGDGPWLSREGIGLIISKLGERSNSRLISECQSLNPPLLEHIPSYRGYQQALRDVCGAIGLDATGQPLQDRPKSPAT